MKLTFRPVVTERIHIENEEGQTIFIIERDSKGIPMLVTMGSCADKITPEQLEAISERTTAFGFADQFSSTNSVTISENGEWE